MYPGAGIRGPQAGENEPEERSSPHFSCYSKEGSRASQGCLERRDGAAAKGLVWPRTLRQIAVYRRAVAAA